MTAKKARHDQPLLEASSRLKLAERQDPYFLHRITSTLFLGYRRRKEAGTWVTRRMVGGGRYAIKNLTASNGKTVIADDYAEANEQTILDFNQAVAAALALAKTDDPSIRTGPATVWKAVENYEADLKKRGKDVKNATRVRMYLRDPGVALPDATDRDRELQALAGRLVSKLVADDFSPWGAALEEARLSAAGINRTNRAFKAALELAKRRDPRIQSSMPWKEGLTKLREDDSEPNNVVLSDADVRGIVAAAYSESVDFGLFVEAIAQTGTRMSQIGGRLRKRDLKPGRAPGFMMPVSDKGGGKKTVTHYWAPIKADLAMRLQQYAKDKRDGDLLFAKPNGKPWLVKTGAGWNKYYAEEFERAREAAKVEPYKDGKRVTMYALRHTHITRQLQHKVPTSIVAAAHDTSEPQIRRHYAAYITEHSDELLRRTLLDLSAVNDVAAAA